MRFRFESNSVVVFKQDGFAVAGLDLQERLSDRDIEFVSFATSSPAGMRIYHGMHYAPQYGNILFALAYKPVPRQTIVAHCGAERLAEHAGGNSFVYVILAVAGLSEHTTALEQKLGALLGKVPFIDMLGSGETRQKEDGEFCKRLIEKYFRS